MIVLFILNALLLASDYLISFLPRVDTLPFGLDALFVTYWGYMHSFMTEFWFLNRVLYDFSILLSISVLMLVVKAFLGSRVEDHS